jgi:hypothetical protein
MHFHLMESRFKLAVATAAEHVVGLREAGDRSRNED